MPSGKAESPSRRRPWIAAIHAALDAGVKDGAFPGGACAVYHGGDLVHRSSAGLAVEWPHPIPAAPGTVYDLASLTKVLATTCVAASLCARGALWLDQPVARWLPVFGRGNKAGITVRDLLAHRSGLPAFRPFFARVQADPDAAPLYARSARRPPPSACRRGKAMVAEAALHEPLERPPREAAAYSDVGFVVLGLLLEAVGGAGLDALADDLVFRPWRLPSLHFRPLCLRTRRVASLAATGLVRPREPAPGQEGLHAPGASRALVLGEVDDDNAYAMGGIAGHAGLFGNAVDVAHQGALILEELDGASRVAPASVWAELARRDGTPGSTRALGFDTPSPESSSAGSLLGKGPLGALGHLGFTGTSLWIDRDRTLSVALLTNRVHPTRAREGIRAFRPRFHDAVVRAIEGLGQATS